MSFLLDLESYNVQQEEFWPRQGRVILSQFTDKSIIVYQTTEYQSSGGNAEKYGAINGSDARSETGVKENNWNAVGASSKRKKDKDIDSHIAGESSHNLPNFSVRFETSFVRAMYNCEWGKASGYGRVLATLLKLEGFEEILQDYLKNIKSKNPTGDVSIEWKADRSPSGHILNRYVPEFTIRGNILQQFYSKWTLSVKDITKYVDHQRRFIGSGLLKRAWTPKEIVYRSDLSEQCVTLDIENNNLHDDDVVDDDGDDDDIKQGSQDILDITLADSSDLWKSISDPREAILYLYGAFNPIHLGHVNALLAGKSWLETEGKYTVCATRIALASDPNIKQKNANSGDLCIKFEHRLKLCELACQDHDFIKICPYPFNSQSTVGEKTRKELDKPDATLVPLMGSDRAYLNKRRLKAYRGDNKFVLCVGRKGMSKAERDTFECAEKIIPTLSYDFFVVPTEFNEISSTKVRQKLSQMKGNHSEGKHGSKNNSLIMKELVKLGWISDREGDYICENINTLFF